MYRLTGLVSGWLHRLPLQIRWNTIIKKTDKAMKGKSQHVVKHPEGWAVKGAGNQKATRITNTQKEAIEVGRAIAKNQQSELVIHGQNGQIRAKDSHGHDPKKIKG